VISAQVGERGPPGRVVGAARQRALDQRGRGGPPGGPVGGGQAVGRGGLHEPVDRHLAVHGRADEGQPAQRADRVVDGRRV
jgi:hypothetical protein